MVRLCQRHPSSLTDLRPLVPHPRRLSPWDSAYRTLTQYHQAPERLKPFTDNVKFPRITQITLDEACKELDVFCTSMAVGEEVLSCIPPMEEALRLCEIYFDCSKFLCVAISCFGAPVD